MLNTIGIGASFGRVLSPLTQLTSLVRGLGGTIYAPGLGTVWQDAAGTTAGVVDSVVGNAKDLAGTKNSTQGTTAYKPVLKKTNGKFNLLFNGTNNFLQTPINPTSSGYILVVVRQDEAIGSWNTIFGAYKTSSPYQPGCGLYVSSTGATGFIRCKSDGTLVNISASLNITVGVAFVVDANWTASGANIRFNGANSGASSTTADAANSGTTLILGGLNGGTAVAPVLNTALQGGIFLAVYIPSVPTTAQMTTMRNLAAQITGVTGVV